MVSNGILLPSIIKKPSVVGFYLGFLIVLEGAN